MNKRHSSFTIFLGHLLTLTDFFSNYIYLSFIQLHLQQFPYKAIDYSCLVFYIQQNIVKYENEVIASQKRKIEVLCGKIERNKFD